MHACILVCNNKRPTVWNFLSIILSTICLSNFVLNVYVLIERYLKILGRAFSEKSMSPNEIDAFLIEGKVSIGNFVRITRASNGSITMKYQGKSNAHSLFGLNVETGQLIVIKYGVITSIEKIPDTVVLSIIGNKANQNTL